MESDVRRLYIGGHWQEAAGGGSFPVHDPATGEVIAQVADGDRRDASAAIAAAAAAFPAWAALTAKERSRLLLDVHARLLARREELAAIIVREQGKPLTEARSEVDYAAEFFSWFGEEARRVYGETIPASAPNKRLTVIKQPVGVVAAISPWNFPAATITKKIAPALAAGCPVVIKPAEQTPLTAVALVAIMAEAGLPAGVVNLITAADPRPIGEEFLTNPAVAKISFTGSTSVGKLLARGAAEQMKGIALELGGHSPFIVFADADLEAAAQAAWACKFRTAGQTCTCANRIYVEASVAERFNTLFAPRVAATRVGRGFAPVDFGPLIDVQGFEKVTRHVADAVAKGARVLTGGHRLTGGPYEGGYFYAPTLLADVTPDMLCCQEETFGPVAPVATFADEAAAIRLANQTRYGLGAYFFTNDLSRAHRVAEALQYGVVGVNDPFPAVPQAPFGGVKESGIGREGGRQGLEEFLQVKFVSTVIRPAASSTP